MAVYQDRELAYRLSCLMVDARIQAGSASGDDRRAR